MGTLLHSCAEVLEPIELSFGVVCGVGPGIGLLHGFDVLQEGAVLVSMGFNGVFVEQKCIQLVGEKVIIFPYGQYIIGIYISLVFQRYSQVRGQCWGLREFAKMQHSI